MIDEKFEKDEIVIIDYSTYGRLNLRKGKVIETTKAGNVKVLQEGKIRHDLFTSYGKMRGDSSWNATYLRKFSQSLWDKFLEQEKRSKIILKIRNINFRDFSIEDLREIEKIVDKHTTLEQQGG